MCVAVPGKVVKIEGSHGTVDYNGNLMNINLSLIDAKEGDYVLFHAGCALEIMEKQDAEALIDLFKEIEAVTQ